MRINLNQMPIVINYNTKENITNEKPILKVNTIDKNNPRNTTKFLACTV